LHLIIGVDPGTTTGISALDLNGNLIKIISIRNAGKAEVIKQILNMGKSSIIATDKRPCPEFVLKIAASFNVKLFIPEKEFSQEEKSRLIKENKIKIENDHERDAYSASYKAYFEYANRLRQVNSLEYSEEEKDYLKHLILNGHSLKNALLFLEKTEEKIKEEIKDKPTKRDKHIEEWIEEIKNITRENQELKKQIQKLKLEKEQIEWEIKKEKNIRKKEIEKDKEVIKLKNEIIRLKLYIESKKNKKKKKKIKEEQNTKYLKNMVENIITEYRDKRKKEIN
jgi:hypothetical protein